MQLVAIGTAYVYWHGMDVLTVALCQPPKQGTHQIDQIGTNGAITSGGFFVRAAVSLDQDVVIGSLIHCCVQQNMLLQSTNQP